MFSDYFVRIHNILREELVVWLSSGATWDLSISVSYYTTRPEHTLFKYSLGLSNGDNEFFTKEIRIFEEQVLIMQNEKWKDFDILWRLLKHIYTTDDCRYSANAFSWYGTCVSKNGAYWKFSLVPGVKLISVNLQCALTVLYFTKYLTKMTWRWYAYLLLSTTFKFRRKL